MESTITLRIQGESMNVETGGKKGSFFISKF